MKTKLERVAEKAKSDQKLRFNCLAHLLTPGFMAETWQKINKRGAAGIDEETITAFGWQLDERVNDLHERLVRGVYKAPAVRRVEIPKGENKVRKLGIPTVEDRLLQGSVARILNAIYEPLFLSCSYGFRPGRSAHDALRALRGHLIGGKVMQVFEADIRAYFDEVNHEWLMRMLKERISDKVILRLILKWLKAGVMENGLKLKSISGVPQGGPVSCILSNIYLHYVLDLWFEKKVKKSCKGEAHLVRYVDDYVVCFQYKSDAETFSKLIEERFSKFNLRLAEEKTRRITFGRFARERCREFGIPLEEFVFLGFRHICGTDRQGRYALIRIPSVKSCRKFKDRVKEWFERRIHWKVKDQQAHLACMLRGFYQYFALPHCTSKLYLIHGWVERFWRHILQRRSQKSKTHWSYLSTREWFKLPTPKSLHQSV